jgi:hypothetical protein
MMTTAGNTIGLTKPMEVMDEDHHEAQDLGAHTEAADNLHSEVIKEDSA